MLSLDGLPAWRAHLQNFFWFCCGAFFLGATLSQAMAELPPAADSMEEVRTEEPPEVALRFGECLRDAHAQATCTRGHSG